MERLTASDFDQEVLDLYDEYVHGQTDRRGFLDRAAKFAVGGMTAAALLDNLKPDYALAAQVAEDDKRIKTSYVSYPSPAKVTKKRRAFWSSPVPRVRCPVFS